MGEPVQEGAAPRIRVVGERAQLVRNAVLRARTDLDRVRRLFDLILRLAREAWSGLGLKLVACVGVRLAGTGAQLASILLLTAYLDRVLDDAALTLPLAGEVPARAEGVIYAAGTIIVGLFTLSGVLNYLYGRWSWRLANAFELHLIRRSVYTLSATPLWRSEFDGVPATASTIHQAIGGDPRRAQFTLRYLLEGAVEPVAIAAWVGALAWLNPALTALIVPVSLVTLPFVMQVNLRASNMTRDLERTSASAAPERRLIDHRLRHGLIDPARRDPWLERFLTHGHIAANVRAFGSRRIVLEESKAVSTLAFGGLLLLVVWFGGTAALRGDMTWGALVAYLLILRALLGQAVSLGGTLTHFSRFYPILSRYFALVDGASAAAREGATTAVPASRAVVTVRARSLDGDAASLELRAGERIGVLTSATPTPYLVRTLCAAVEDAVQGSLAGLFGQVAFASGTPPRANAPLRATFAIADERTRDQAGRRLDEAGLGGLARTLRELDLDQPLAPRELKRLPGFFSQALQLSLADLSRAPTVVVDARAVFKIPVGPRRALLDGLNERLILFVYRHDVSLRHLFAFDERALLVDVAGLSELVYLVRSSEWPESERRLKSVMRKNASQSARPASDDAEVELDDDDM